MNNEKKADNRLQKAETRNYLPEAILGALILVAFFSILMILIS